MQLFIFLIECLKNYGQRFVTLYRRQWSRPFPNKKKYKEGKQLSEEVLQIAEKRREVKGKVIHFEFILVYGVRKCCSFILLQVVDQFSQHYLLKRLSLIHCIFLPPLSKIRYPYVRGFISGLSILFHWSIFLSLCQYHTSWWLWLCSGASSQAGWFLQFHSFSRWFWLFEAFCISIQIVKLFVLALWRIPL